jgi:hypothetical protein
MHVEQNTVRICIITASCYFLRSQYWNFAEEYLLRSDSSVDLGHWLLSDINYVGLSKYTAVQFAVYNTVW